MSDRSRHPPLAARMPELRGQRPSLRNAPLMDDCQGVSSNRGFENQVKRDS